MRNQQIKWNIILVLLCFQSITFAQQDPHFTQYFDNTLFVNPAYAGSRGMLNITGMHREQWVGFEGRPRSTTFSIHSPLNYESIGLGMTMVADEAGPVKQTMFYADFSYTFKLSSDNRQKLAVGIKSGFNMIGFDPSGLNTTTPNDSKLGQNARTKFNPNVGFGLYYHNPSFFFGMSTPKLLENSYDNTPNSNNKERRHYFAIVGGVFKLSGLWKLRPAAQVKMTTGAPVSIDLSTAGIYAEKFWLGVNYRYDAAIGVFTQFQITPQFKLGLASDFGLQAIRTYNSGTFELMASYDFVFKKQGIRSPRYF
jgi:type IX secretion system PorP/SprF family membrane protein